MCDLGGDIVRRIRCLSLLGVMQSTTQPSYSFLFTYLFLGINIKIMWRGHILNKLANKGDFLF